ncbi:MULTISPECIES: MFS transporter [unclassified Paraburkholderia]|uniref:MFS transporter n=1 Tax=unclassified Paraburkholderia TaxID=2615204 RepID=UPI002AB67B32|nr:MULTISPECIES: MFS transporter [unclassified Paraburkholderia]
MQQNLASSIDTASAASHRGSRTRTIIATSAGNALEMFDFTVFSYFAALIAKAFFPVDSGAGSMLLALATFGVGFVMRPLGGVLIGGYADRKGRKAALTLTIALMMAGTALIALTPTYAQIGVAAPIAVVAGRLLQGLSAGGEIGTATAFLMESGPLSRRGFMVSFQMMSQGVAALLGALSGALLSAVLPPDALEAWGWRLPFLFGLLVGPVGLYIRRHLDETHTPEPKTQSAVRELLAGYKSRLLLGVLMIVGPTSMLYIMVFYMPGYAVRALHLPVATSFLAGCASGLTMTLAALLAGLCIIDRLPRRKPLVFVTTLLSLLCVYPSFRVLLSSPSIPVLIAIVTVVMGLATLGTSSFFLLIMEAFPQRVRATALAVIYSVGVTVFGGFAQFNVTWLLQHTGDAMSPAWYLLAAGTVSLVAIASFPERRGIGAAQ